MNRDLIYELHGGVAGLARRTVISSDGVVKVVSGNHSRMAILSSQQLESIEDCFTEWNRWYGDYMQEWDVIDDLVMEISFEGKTLRANASVELPGPVREVQEKLEWVTRLAFENK